MPIFPPDLDPLFSERSLTTLLRGQIARMELAINELGDDVLLQNSPDDLIETGRRDRLLKARDVAASLGYPLYQRNGAPVTYVSPVIRRKIVTNLSGTFKPEPTLLESEYQNI